MKLKKRKKKKRLQMPEVSLTPLIDTALTLLIIFMVAAPMVHNGIKLDLPQGKSKEAPGQQEFVVAVNKNGEIYFNSYPVKREALISSVQEAMKDQTDQPVFVRADETVSYGKVIEVVDELKQAGVQYVAMSTRPSA